MSEKSLYSRLREVFEDNKLGNFDLELRKVLSFSITTELNPSESKIDAEIDALKADFSESKALISALIGALGL